MEVMECIPEALGAHSELSVGQESVTIEGDPIQQSEEAGLAWLASLCDLLRRRPASSRPPHRLAVNAPSLAMPWHRPFALPSG